MANPKHKLNREDLMAFLLGELEEAEQSRIESMFLQDESLRDEIESAKSDLFQAYESGRLSERRSGAFKERFLPASIEKDREEFREMLAQNEAERAREAREQEAPQAADAVVGKKNSPVRRSVAPAVAVPPVAAAAVPPVAHAAKKSRIIPILLGAIVIIAGAVAAFFLMREASSTDSATAEVTLRSFSVRGQSQLIALPDSPEVVLRLPHAHTGSFASYQVRRFFESESQDQPSTVIDGVVAVIVTRSSLQEGRYDLELRGVRDDGASEVLGYYSFQK